MFRENDIIVSRASYKKNRNAAPRSVVVRVYDDGRLLRYCLRYNARYIVERPELWLVVGKRGVGDSLKEAE